MSIIPTYGQFNKTGSKDLKFYEMRSYARAYNYNTKQSYGCTPITIKKESDNTSSIDTTGLNLDVKDPISYSISTDSEPLSKSSKIQYTFEFSINELLSSFYLQLYNNRAIMSFALNGTGIQMKLNTYHDNYDINHVLNINIKLNDIVTIVMDNSMMYVGVNSILVCQINTACLFKSDDNKDKIKITPTLSISSYANNVPVIINNIKYYSTILTSPSMIIDDVSVLHICELSMIDRMLRYSYPIAFISSIIVSVFSILNIDMTYLLLNKTGHTIYNIITIICCYISLCTWFKIIPYVIYPHITSIYNNSELHKSIKNIDDKIYIEIP
jgi:hypothetical protein